MRVRAEAAAEVARFAEVMGTKPEVAVPTTFIWTTEAESGWVQGGIRVVVTPGRRSEHRDAGGGLAGIGDHHFNGEVGAAGAAYVVRDAYFEPHLGHTHERALAAVRSRTRRGRPTLIEIHRINFLSSSAMADRASSELRKFLEAASLSFRNVRYLSTAELAAHLRARSGLVDERMSTRVHYALRRMADNARLRRLACVSGAIVPAWIVYALTGRRRLPAAQSASRDRGGPR
jgi:hypothetical protein